jgi:hypothetical protein
LERTPWGKAADHENIPSTLSLSGALGVWAFKKFRFIEGNATCYSEVEYWVLGRLLTISSGPFWWFCIFAYAICSIPFLNYIYITALTMLVAIVGALIVVALQFIGDLLCRCIVDEINIGLSGLSVCDFEGDIPFFCTLTYLQGCGCLCILPYPRVQWVSTTSQWKCLHILLVSALAAIVSNFCASTEKVIAHNHVITEGNTWTFGQILAVLLLFPPVWSFVDTLAEMRKRGKLVPIGGMPQLNADPPIEEGIDMDSASNTGQHW